MASNAIRAASNASAIRREASREEMKRGGPALADGAGQTELLRQQNAQLQLENDRLRAEVARLSDLVSTLVFSDGGAFIELSRMSVADVQEAAPIFAKHFVQREVLAQCVKTTVSAAGRAATRTASLLSWSSRAVGLSLASALCAWRPLRLAAA